METVKLYGTKKIHHKALNAFGFGLFMEFVNYKIVEYCQTNPLILCSWCWYKTHLDQI